MALKVNSENSIYTWASASIIFLNAMLMFVIALRTPTRFLAWLSPAVVFVLLSMDEALSFHERTSSIVGSLVETGGVFHFAWVIPALVLCLVLGLAYVPFLWSLPSATMMLLVLAEQIVVLPPLRTAFERPKEPVLRKEHKLRRRQIAAAHEPA